MDKSGLYRVINNLRNTITLEHCVIRFIMAWCFVSLVESFIMNSRRYMINSLSYVKNVDMVSVIICSLVLTIVLYAIFEKLQDNNRLKACILEGTLLTGVVLVYACVCVYEYNDVYFVAGMTLVVLAAAVYSYSYVHKIYKGYISDSTTYNADIKDISKRMYITGVAIVAGVMTAFISICMVFRYLSFGSPNFDMGLFSQMFQLKGEYSWYFDFPILVFIIMAALLCTFDRTSKTKNIITGGVVALLIQSSVILGTMLHRINNLQQVYQKEQELFYSKTLKADAVTQCIGLFVFE